MSAAVPAVFEAVKVAGFDVAWMQQALGAMPLNQYGFPWLLPTIAGCVIGKFLPFGRTRG